MTAMTAVILMLFGQMFHSPDALDFLEPSRAETAVIEAPFGLRLEVRPRVQEAVECLLEWDDGYWFLDFNATSR